MSLFQHKTNTDLKAKELMDVILDFEAYPQIVSSVKKTEILKQGPPVWEVVFAIEVIRNFEYTLRLELRSEYELHWSLVNGFFVKNNGFWILEPVEDEARDEARDEAQDETRHETLVTYGVEMEMDTYLPTSIRNSLARHKLPKMVDGFIQEAKMRAMAKIIERSVLSGTDQDEN